MYWNNYIAVYLLELVDCITWPKYIEVYVLNLVQCCACTGLNSLKCKLDLVDCSVRTGLTTM